MIKHSAMPQRCRKSLTPQELGELAFRSLVAWLEEPCTAQSWESLKYLNKVRYQGHKHRHHCPGCIHSLLKAVEK